MIGWALAASVALGADDAPVVKNEAWCFGSGLRVIFEQDHARPEVRVTTIVDGGSGGEATGKDGVAHVVEHLWFRSRPEGVDSDVWTAVGALGGRLNGYTVFDRTVFMSVAPKARLRTLLQLEAARLEDPFATLEESVFEVERNVVRNELRQRYTDTGWSLVGPLYAAMFPEGHPYHHLPIGTEATLEALTLDDAREYGRAWYRPEHTTIHVSGDVGSDGFADLLPQVFSKALLVDPDSGAVTHECGERRGEGVPLPEVVRGEPVEVEGAVRNRVVVLGWMFPPGQAGLARFDVAIAAIAMRENLERSVDCWLDPGRHAALGFCSFGVGDDEKPEKLAQGASIAVGKWWEPNQRARLDLNYDFWRVAQSAQIYRQLDRRGFEAVAQHFHETGQQDWLPHWMSTFELEDFSEAAKLGIRHMAWKKTHMVVVRPGDDDPDALASFHGARDDEVFASLSAGDVDAELLAGIIGEPRWSTARQTTLKNGLVVTVVPYGTYDTVRAALYFPGGRRAEPEPGLDALTWSMLPSTTTDEYRAALSLYGAWWVRRSASYWMYRIDGTDLEGQLKLLKRHLGGQIPKGSPRESIERMTRPRDASAATRAHEAREAAFLGEAAQPREKLVASVEALKTADLKGWAASQLRPEGAHLVIIGNVEPARALSAARSQFERMKGPEGERESASRVVVEVPEAPVLLKLEDDVKRTQVTLDLTCRVDGSSQTADTLAAIVRESVEGELRRERGLTYGVQAWRASDVGGQRLRLRTQVQRAGAQDALGVVRSTLAKLAGEGPDAETLAAARLDRARAQADRLQDSDDLMAFVGRSVRAGKKPDAFGGFAERLMAVDAEAVKKALGTCVGHEVISVVGTDVQALE